MRIFTNEDWMAYQGAQRFADGKAPLIGEYGPLTIIIDRSGLQAWIDGAEDEGFEVSSYYGIEYLKELAMRILSDVKGRSPREIQDLLSTL